MANSRATGSASDLRATKPSACADSRSTHCASSTTHSRGRSREASASRLNAARPTSSCSGAALLLMPNAVPIAARCGSGSWSSRSSIGAHRAWSAANGRSISASTPEARATLNSVAAPNAYPRRADLPTPGSPRNTRTRLCPPRTTSNSSSSASHSVARPSNIDARLAGVAQSHPRRDSETRQGADCQL